MLSEQQTVKCRPVFQSCLMYAKPVPIFCFSAKVKYEHLSDIFGGIFCGFDQYNISLGTSGIGADHN